MVTISTAVLILLAIHVNLSISQEIQTLCKSEFEKISNSFPREFEWYCHLRQDVTFHVLKFSIKILCTTPKLFHWKFPAVNLGFILDIEIYNCSFPENDTLSQIVEQFGIKDLRRFKANNAKNSFDDQFFNRFHDLQILSLIKNQIRELNKNMFKSIRNLRELDLSNNDLENLESGVFKYLNYLKVLNLNDNKLKRLSKDAFEGLLSLTFLEIRGNDLKVLNDVHSLPSKLFADQNKMFYLTLSDNELIELQDGSFVDMKALGVLVLSNNRLTTISESTFRGLANLQTIRLDGNQLKTVHTNAFLHTKHLRVLYLENNQLSLLKYEDLQQFKSRRISIDLRENMIRNVYFPSNRNFITNGNVIRLSLRNNPLICDCNMYDFLKYLQIQSDQATVRIGDANELFCESPTSTVKQKIIELNLEDFTCADSKIRCPSHCQCRRRPNDHSFIFNCSNAALRVVPDIPNIKIENLSFIVVDVHNNSLTELPSLGDNLRVEVIHASNNNINVIKRESLPPKLRYLDMSHNKIQILATDVLDFLRNCARLSLGENPWLCCPPEAKELVSFVNEKIQSITDLDEIKCEDRSVMVLQAVKGSCSVVLTHLALVLLAAFAFLIVILCISTLYYKYNQLIKIWLYSHNLCVWCVDEEELDKDKVFDAFISYSHHDEDFALDTIVNELENGTPSFNMCVHIRDFLPGALISESIAKSIANSRRTIIILSRNYLNSVWGQHEFHCAHGSAVTERRIRLIIIIYGDIGDIELLDPTIKSYLKTNTYLEWGDKWFWKKLRYALTHKNLK